MKKIAVLIDFTGVCELALEHAALMAVAVLSEKDRPRRVQLDERADDEPERRGQNQQYA